MDLSNKKNIRNFSIIAHIDHGKSTLADRLLNLSGTVADRDMQDQIMDSMELERERGITIKLNAAQLTYKAKNGEEYIFHLIDTPGHVDFTYEVSRSLAACEGAVLVVDAAQGIEAQTLANVYLAIDNELEIVPVINKIDLPSAEPEKVIKEIEEDIGIPAEHAPLISAKTGLNVEDVFEAIVEYVPAPVDADESKPLSALIFDSYYDQYRGIIVFARIKHGVVKLGDEIEFMGTGAKYEVVELGVRTPVEVKKKQLVAGEVGWIACSIKNVKDINVGDTITHANNPTTEPYEGYRKMNPMVFCGLFPIDSSQYNDLREAIERIQLSDSSLTWEPETSQALGFGFRVGFLGMLHMEVIQERVEREFGIDLIATAPSVVYHLHLNNGEVIKLDSPSAMPDPQKIDRIEEPYVIATLSTPKEYVGAVMELCDRKRGKYVSLDQMGDSRMIIKYEIPLAEIVFEFFDKLKSITKGYASFDYELSGYKESKLVKMDILLNKEIIDALSIIVHNDTAYARGNIICRKLKEIIPRQAFEVPIQASIGARVIARETIKAMRKNVLAKCYGGDISRKKKLLKKQKEGKKRMKAIGSVEVPQEAFMTVLSMDE